MPFRARNTYYLRISPTSILPLQLYLDDRHVEWMSNRILALVIEDLRILIVPKLKAEADAHLGPGGPANAKRGTVDVHRGETYQFAYFFRKAEPHAVVIKSRNFVTAPPKPKGRQAEPPQNPAPQKAPRKRKQPANRTSGKERSNKKGRSAKATEPSRRGKGKQRAAMNDEEEDTIFTTDESDEDGDEWEGQGDGAANSAPSRRSTRNRKTASNVYREDSDEDAGVAATEGDENNGTGAIDVDSVAGNPSSTDIHMDAEPITQTDVEMGDAESVAEQAATAQPEEPSDVFLAAEEEEEKPKPILQLKFRGFSIFGKMLCIVVEPWPPVQFSRFFSRAPSAAPSSASRSSTRERSIAPPEFVATYEAEQQARSDRAKTPLFLPDFQEESVTPAPEDFGRGSSLHLYSMRAETPEAGGQEPGDESELMLFSQMLNAVGNDRIGDNDDELDGSALFGDADEMRLITE